MGVRIRATDDPTLKSAVDRYLYEYQNVAKAIKFISNACAAQRYVTVDEDSFKLKFT